MKIEEDRVTELLRERGPMRNGEIAQALGIDDPQGRALTKLLRAMAEKAAVAVGIARVVAKYCFAHVLAR